MPNQKTIHSLKSKKIMEEKPKYMYLVLKEHNGEYQYFHKNVHIFHNSKAATRERFYKNYFHIKKR